MRSKTPGVSIHQNTCTFSTSYQEQLGDSYRRTSARIALPVVKFWTDQYFSGTMTDSSARDHQQISRELMLSMGEAGMPDIQSAITMRG